jgi:hypothetical protein
MNLVPLGAISDVDGGARLIGPRTEPGEVFHAVEPRGFATRRSGKACMGCRLSLSSTMLAFTSMVGGSSLASALRAVPLTAGKVAGARLIGRGVRGLKTLCRVCPWRMSGGVALFLTAPKTGIKC